MIICGNNNFFQLDSTSNSRDMYGRPIISPPTELSAEFSLNISSYSTCYDHTIAITKDGNMYAIGNNLNGQILPSLKKKKLEHFVKFRITDNDRHTYHPISAVCGEDYSLYLISNDKNDDKRNLFYTCKNNKPDSPLFVNTHNLNPISIYGGLKNAAAIGDEGSILIIRAPCKSSSKYITEKVKLPSNEKAVSIACCNKFIVVSSSSGFVYFSEINNEVDFDVKLVNFHKINSIEDHKIVQVSGISDHCFAVSEDGRVFGYGSNLNGQLGLGKEIKVLSEFIEIFPNGLHKIKAAYAGSSHSLFQTKRGKILACGSNFFGQLLNESGPSNDIVWHPSETNITNAIFCVVGVGISIVFTAFNPIESPNKNIEIENRQDKSVETHLPMFDDSEEEKRILQEDIIRLQNKIIRLKNKRNKLKTENEHLKEENNLNLELNANLTDEYNLIKEENAKLKEKNNLIKEENTNLKEENNLIKEENTNLKEENNLIKEENTKLKEKYDKLKTVDIKINEKNNRLEIDIKHLLNDNEKLKKQVDELMIQSGKYPSWPPKQINLEYYDQKRIDKEMIKDENLGKGGQATVFKIKHVQYLALKVLNFSDKFRYSRSSHDTLDNSEEFEQFRRFLQEYEILRSLNNKNIVRALGFCTGDEKNQPSILLQYCPQNLKEIVKDINDVQRVCIIFEICNAMEAVHAANIIHRDLKPENILIDEDNHVRICDFGISYIFDIDSQTKSMTALGTLGFMSPELLNESEKYDHKVDVYSFGVVLFFILTKGLMPNISIGDQLKGLMAPIPPHINELSANLIKKCWSKKADDRPSFSEIVQLIKNNDFNLINNVDRNLTEIKKFLSLE